MPTFEEIQRNEMLHNAVTLAAAAQRVLDHASNFYWDHLPSCRQQETGGVCNCGLPELAEAIKGGGGK